MRVLGWREGYMGGCWGVEEIEIGGVRYLRIFVFYFVNRGSFLNVV